MEMVDQKMEIYRILKTDEVKQEKNVDDVQIDVFNTVLIMSKQRREMVSTILCTFRRKYTFILLNCIVLRLGHF